MFHWLKVDMMTSYLSDDCFANGIQALQYRWNKSVDCYRKYAEKNSFRHILWENLVQPMNIFASIYLSIYLSIGMRVIVCVCVCVCV